MEILFNFGVRRRRQEDIIELWSTTDQPVISPTQPWPENVGFQFGALPIFQMNLGIGILTWYLMVFEC